MMNNGNVDQFYFLTYIYLEQRKLCDPKINVKFGTDIYYVAFECKELFWNDVCIFLICAAQMSLLILIKFGM